MPERGDFHGCEDDGREALLAAARTVASGAGGAAGAAAGPGAGDSFSMRWRRSGAEGFLITPAASNGSPWTLDDILWMPLQEDSRARDLDGVRRPPSDWRLHRALYRQRPGTGAIIGSTPPFCTTLSCNPGVQQEGIPAFHPDIGLAGGDSIRCAAYAGLDAPSAFDSVAAALADRRACLLAAYGLLAIGATPKAAAELTLRVETLAQVYWQVLQVVPVSQADQAAPGRQAAGRAMPAMPD